jgi:hypothetical protein
VQGRQVFVPQVVIEKTICRAPRENKIRRWSVDHAEPVVSWEQAADLYARVAGGLSDADASVTALTPTDGLTNARADTKLASIATGVDEPLDGRSAFRSPLGLLLDLQNQGRELPKLATKDGPEERFALPDKDLEFEIAKVQPAGVAFLSRVDRYDHDGRVLLSHRFDQLRSFGPGVPSVPTRRELRARRLTPGELPSGLRTRRASGPVDDPSTDEDGLVSRGYAFLVAARFNPPTDQGDFRVDLRNRSVVKPGQEGEAWRGAPNSAAIEAALSSDFDPPRWPMLLILGSGALSLLVGILILRKRRT